MKSFECLFYESRDTRIRHLIRRTLWFLLETLQNTFFHYYYLFNFYCFIYKLRDKRTE